MAGTGDGLRRRGPIAIGLTAIVVLTLVIATQLVPVAGGGATPTSTPEPPGTPAPSPVVVVPTPTPPTPPPPTPPPPTPEPTPPLVQAPLTGLLVTADAAARHPIAVMIDDHAGARPQSGFNAAAVVWHAPAEGGIPRYMLIFQDQVPTDVGPIRSSRQYYIEWAAEWRALYVHHGGSPQALDTLRARGDGTWVWNADGTRWQGRYVFRVTFRFSPHNVYSDGEHLRALADRVGAVDGPVEPVWSFGPDGDPFRRPSGGTVRVVYPYETITYRYDAATNRYVRYLNQSKTPQVDAADGQVVAPANVVILRMRFGPLNDGHPEKHRLEAADVGSGEAWIATNGRTVKGTWSKASPTAPTLLFGPDGEPITLTAGQTFVQVLALTYDFSVNDGDPPVWIPPQHRVP